ncbi:MAG: 5-formyltetrahydrofolate cyclo-ligase [Bacteroidaceae bacterium]|nr:5-formyltetrahydrofolate cyclo-ligase [Bacteroidaceae bacterium]
MTSLHNHFDHSLQQAKSQLRAYMREAKRDFMSSTPLVEQHLLSERILELVEQLPQFVEAKVVLAYYSLDDELFTHDTVQRWAESKTVLLPKVTGDSLTLHPYTNILSLRRGAYGIMEPCTPEFTDYDAVDLVLVPGVAFDSAGNRLGRGRGYYDRLFANLLPAAVTKVGVCYPFQLVDHVPAEPTDVRMDAILN